LEYKQREYMYIAQICTLQKKLIQLQQTIPDWRNEHDVVDCQMRRAIVDPTVNLEIKELRTKLFEKDQEIRKLKGELQAANFSTDSTMGRKLINKCKALQEENNDLGKLLAEERLQPLQMQIAALQKQQNVYKHHLKQIYELNKELDEENETLTQKLTVQRQMLKYSQDDVERFRVENDRYRTMLAADETYARTSPADRSPSKNAAPEESSTLQSPEAVVEREAAPAEDSAPQSDVM